MSKVRSVAQVFRRLHLWLGLSLGLILVIIGLSGSALVFYIEIDEMLHPNIKQVSRQSPDFQQALTTLRQTFPDKQGSWRLEVTPNGHNIPARYYNPVETQHRGFAPMMVWLSPDGKHILRRDYWGDYLVTWLYNLHYSLLIGKTGTWVLGYIGLIGFILMVSGLVAWWPKQGQWLKKIRFKPRSSSIGLLYDWHKLIGLISFIPLNILVITGVMLALPNETNTVLKATIGKVSEPSHSNMVVLDRSASLNLISINRAIQSAKLAMPNAQLAWIETPLSTGGFYKLRMQLPSDPSRRFPHSYLQIDDYSGNVVNVFDTSKQGLSNTIKDWLHPLHNGNLSSVLGESLIAQITAVLFRIIWVLTGLALVALFILGFARWLLRIKKRSTV